MRVAPVQYYGTGRRKSSTARVFCGLEKAVVLNKRAFEAILIITLRMIIRQPSC